ncbi:endonuclease/exonuclease/phosphatase family protein [Marinibacterium sp. SX1]|uniref:endonuclease/exonuclease/phosphatase family protein n=1 Tax=Marinibacterium sp. SX1 TaxID=3388424 RepID=UPI003D163A8C
MTRAVAAAVLTFLILLLALPGALHAQPERLRVALLDAELRRDGPGLLLRDIQKGDAQVDAVVAVIAHARPDVLVLLGFDWDHDGRALAALADRLAAAGAGYDHLFTARPNSGRASGIDLDGDGRRGGPGDAQGYGHFTGQGGMAILSRHPILAGDMHDFSGLAWADLPGALLPVDAAGGPFPSQAAQEAQLLSSRAHWVVPVALPGGQVMELLSFHAGPPVFDGPEDRNGRRNHDELLFWRHYLDGVFGPGPGAFYVLAGGANLDPFDNDGRHGAIRALLEDPRLVDTRPASPGAAGAGTQGHAGPDALDTVDWGFGRFRVDYVLPAPGWTVLDSGVLWPGPDDPLAEVVTAASRHRLVWVDLALP